jgi:hypothetical protein
MIGFEKSRILLVLIYLAGTISIYYLSKLSSSINIIPLVLQLLALPIGISIIKRFYSTQNHNDRSLKLLRVKAAQLHLISGIILCIGLGFNIWF